MKKSKLYQSPVIFNEEEHVYSLNGNRLSGITRIISKYIFPDMYAGVSEETLNKAAERGTAIHKAIHDGLVSRKREDGEPQEVTNFFQYCKKHHLYFCESEYLVDNGFNIASSIDIVDTNYNLYDIKTYADVTSDKRESARWQLSIYKYLFELCNPEKKVGKLFIFHLRDEKCALIELQPIPSSAIESLINAFSLDLESFDNPLDRICDKDEIVLLNDLQCAHKNAEYWSNKEAEMKEGIKAFMLGNGSRKIEKNGIKFTISEGKVTKKFNSKKFAAEHPKSYEKYLEESKSAESLTVTFPKE